MLRSGGEGYRASPQAHFQPDRQRLGARDPRGLAPVSIGRKTYLTFLPLKGTGIISMQGYPLSLSRSLISPLLFCIVLAWSFSPASRVTGAETSPLRLRDDGTYQNGAYWATPLPWLMDTLLAADVERAALTFCEAVEDFKARGDINEWINDEARKKRGVRDYCASAAMPLAGAQRLRAHLEAMGKALPRELQTRFDENERWLRERAKLILRGSSQLGKDNIRIFTPDATGGYGAFWVRDWSYAVEGCPEAFTWDEIREGYLFLVRAQRADGCMPDRVRPDGVGVYSPGEESKPFSKNGSVDQSPFMVRLCYQYWILSDDLQPFRQTAAALEKAMEFTPRDASTGLVVIEDTTLFRPYSFLDTVPLSGAQQFDSVLYWQACGHLSELFSAAQQPAKAARWAAEAEKIQSSMTSLWDDDAGWFVAASVSWRQPSIWGSLFAVASGIASDAQCERIVQSSLKQYDLFVYRGQIRHLLKGTFWGKPEPEYSPRK